MLILISIIGLIYITTCVDLTVHYYTAPIFPNDFEINNRNGESSLVDMGIQYTLNKDNKESKCRFSILLGSMFYSNGIDTYEVWDLNKHEDPQSRWTKLEINNYLYNNYKERKFFN